jgi:holo-[acyl-carrier protein] synthase
VVLAIGTDLVEVERISQSIQQFGDRFLKRIYTSGERAYAESRPNSAQSFAARFAAKEAAIKALGAPWQLGIRWVDFEVHQAPSGQPQIKLHGAAAQAAKDIGVSRTLLTLTHTTSMAMAVVVFEGSA